ncbi:MAG: urea carboxylase-associated family protein [Rickettsiaceae bacterium]|jgi:uncharacterized protein YcgI (DUF1989 family)|nr:urea carboxylase-associated family protein [Rickettsiaceae bacterium]
MQKTNIIPPQSGTAFVLKKDQCLKIIDVEGQQVCDLMCYNLHDKNEYLSSGRTIDYAEKILLGQGDKFYSNRSNIMFEILEDKVGRHDFLLTPCSSKMFELAYGEKNPHPGCFDNLAGAFKKYEVAPDAIATTFNIFMNVEVEQESGKISIKNPLSKAGDFLLIKAQMDLIIGLTACSDKLTNCGSFKPIGFEIVK